LRALGLTPQRAARAGGLVNRLNILSLILVLGFIGGFPIIVGIYVYDPDSLKFFLSLLIKIRFIFVLLIFICILIFWF
jgi:hypothetical protein